VRILIAHSFYRITGGEDRYVTQQMNLLGPHHNLELLSARNEDLEPDVHTAVRMTYSSVVRKSVDEVLQRFRPDVVHLHNPYPSFGPAVHLSARRHSVPLVVTAHNYRLRCPNGYLFTEGSICHRCEGGNTLNAVLHRCFPGRSQAVTYAASLWTHRYVLKLHDTVDVFIAPSDFMRQKLLSWQIPADRVELVRNFTDVPAASEPPSGNHGVYVGRLSSEKGLDVLLKALALAGDPPFVFVGDGPARSELEELSSALGLRHARFEGRVNNQQVGSFLRQARFATFPSLWHENAPLAALEAMTLGLPLLVADVGGLPELVEPGAGLIFRSGDERALSECLSQLMTNDDLCRSLGSSARSRALKEFNPSRHRSGLEAVYRKAISLTAPAG
jgi:glycosyltransferase involved in cell wall biosynthesis